MFWKAFFEKMSLFLILEWPATLKLESGFFGSFLEFKAGESKNMQIHIVRC